MELYEAPEVYERVIWEDDVKHNQIRLVVNTFRGVEYLHLRKYYLDFEEEWRPSGDGIAFPLEVDNTRELFTGLAEIISLAESREVIEELFGDLIQGLYK
mgnify:CR=1 FL=1|jgi:hypothetical protein